jgi:two-component system chemotaxis response regulator CheY
LKILIADDDLSLRPVLEAELRRAGHEPVTVGDGHAAWQLLEEERIRLLVVDWLVPGLDGATLIRRIRDAGWARYTYAILLTARNGLGDVVEGFSMGADDYVTKPLRVDELVARIGAGVRILEVEKRLVEALAREEARATRDSLTGLPNRRALRDHARGEISRAVRERTSVGLIMVDLDDFKSINDRFGHAAGDEALRRVAAVLQESRRAYDYTGRWGGDEFLVILPGATASQAGRVAERIREAIQAIELPVAGQAPATVRASLGVAAACPSMSPIGLDELLARADDAMYRTKRDGGDRVILHTPTPEGEVAIPARHERT